MKLEKAKDPIIKEGSFQLPIEGNIFKDYNKYYTPAIEDIHVGYECEILNGYNEWYSIKIELGHIFNDFLFYTRDVSKELSKIFRTPYLTKEQIEAEGFSRIGGLIDPLGTQNYTKGSVFKEDLSTGFFEYTEYSKILKITLRTLDNDVMMDMIKYNGYCPSINEFRTICKLLNIK